jgi:hypothetical protein
MFKRLVEESEWIQRIRSIESRPQFQTFSEVLEAFRFPNLAPISSPAQDAPVVCIVDSGVTSGNAFLSKVVRTKLSKSFLKKKPDNVNDENGHGSAVASLASYYNLNIASGAENQPRVWIASARILDENNQIEDERLFSKVLEEVVVHFSKKGLRIFCLAVGDVRKVWGDSSRRVLPRKSWVARRIDQLSRQWARTSSKAVDITIHEFQVALSFPGEIRQYVELVARELERLVGPNSYFYDNNYVSQLARPGLDLLLQDIYGKRSKLVVVFLCTDYQNKEWCGAEFRVIREIIMKRQHQRVMFIKMDDGMVEGVFKTDGYIDGRRFQPSEVAGFIQERISLIQ